MLLQKKTPFKIQTTVPGASSRVGSLHETFLSKTRGRTGVIPILEEENTVISESPAILSHLCESRGWTDLYGLPGSVDKAEIDSYMHWHHLNTRKISLLTMALLRPQLDLSVSEHNVVDAHKVLTSLDENWLKDEEYIASQHYSIADILAYEEVVQATMTNILDLKDYPNLAAWCSRMESKPFHEEAHAALKTLGSLKESSDTPLMMKRLSAATKEGLKAIQAAQDTYSK
jgi:glutathione S-transferase